MLFRLNPIAGQPLYLQLMQQIRHAIEKGILQDGDQLPGIRSLAQQLVISPATVSKAYSELEHEGYLICAKARARSSPPVGPQSSVFKGFKSPAGTFVN